MFEIGLRLEIEVPGNGGRKPAWLVGRIVACAAGEVSQAVPVYVVCEPPATRNEAQTLTSNLRSYGYIHAQVDRKKKESAGAGRQ